MKPEKKKKKSSDILVHLVMKINFFVSFFTLEFCRIFFEDWGKFLMSEDNYDQWIIFISFPPSTHVSF